MPHLTITAVTAAILGLIFFRLSLNAIKLRRQHKVSLGSGGHDDLERAIRAQGNFAEYVPISLILIACLELNAAPWWLVAVPGVALIVGRLYHAKGINELPPNFRNRVMGMKFTLFNLIGLAALNLGWVTLSLLG
ncbi:MAG: hypothetical protein RLZZ180_2229 [Pseudomonadota bacterium]|jgi:uncharacterized membrane protein YecN with MAPEG domain